MLCALAEIKALKCRFLVSGRLVAPKTKGGGGGGDQEEGEATFDTWESIKDRVTVPKGPLPPDAWDEGALGGLFEGIPEELFRADVSSSQLRKEKEARRGESAGGR